MNKGPVSQYIEHHYRHFNAAALMDAAKGYGTGGRRNDHRAGGKMLNVPAAGVRNLVAVGAVEFDAAKISRRIGIVEGQAPATGARTCADRFGNSADFVADIGLVAEFLAEIDVAELAFVLLEGISIKIDINTG